MLSLPSTVKTPLAKDRSMKWIIIEDDPRPDDYIAALVVRDQKVLFAPLVRHSVFEDKESAMSKATELKKRYRAKGIRIFYPEGHSEKV